MYLVGTGMSAIELRLWRVFNLNLKFQTVHASEPLALPAPLADSEHYSCKFKIIPAAPVARAGRGGAPTRMHWQWPGLGAGLTGPCQCQWPGHSLPVPVAA